MWVWDPSSPELSTIFTFFKRGSGNPKGKKAAGGPDQTKQGEEEESEPTIKKWRIYGHLCYPNTYAILTSIHS
jgi:hypothetical protein